MMHIILLLLALFPVISIITYIDDKFCLEFSRFPPGLVWKSAIFSEMLQLYPESMQCCTFSLNTSLLKVIFLIFRKYGENLLPNTG